MNNPYFLTRQAANLIEDFIREIGRGSSLFLLYGESGVGKSSLLNQLTKTRFKNQTSHQLDFKNSGSGDMSAAVKEIVEAANESDVVIFEHFEEASNKARHQIFESWSTDGRDKKLNIIVSATSTSFNGFRQLAQQFQVEAKSFQLMPCSQADCEAYLLNRLFPHQPFGRLLLSSAVKRSIRQSNGLYSRLDEIIERDGESIELRLGSESQFRVATLAIVLVVVGFIGAATVLYYLNSGSVNLEETEALEVFESIVVQPLEQEVVDEISAPAPSPQPEVRVQPESEPAKEAEQKIEHETEPESKPSEIEPVEVSWFQQYFADSEAWIHSGDGRRGTIQIMSIGFDRFEEESFQAYVKRVEDAGIDASQLHIFKTRAAGQPVYSVIFGEFTDRREANKQLATLPKALGADKPIPRTTGSIADEIKKAQESDGN